MFLCGLIELWQIRFTIITVIAKGVEMKPSRAVYGVVLFAGMITACVTSEPGQITEEISQARPGDTVETSTVVSESGAEPRACTIAAFCGPPRFCVRTGPCNNGQALSLALTFCLNHCNASNCNTILNQGACN
jgi:hypothetical protein